MTEQIDTIQKTPTAIITEKKAPVENAVRIRTGETGDAAL